MSAIRLSAQNYCTSCDNRDEVNNKKICSEYNQPVAEAMKNCKMLIPFKNYKEFKDGKSKIAN